MCTEPSGAELKHLEIKLTVRFSCPWTNFKITYAAVYIWAYFFQVFESTVQTTDWTTLSAVHGTKFSFETTTLPFVFDDKFSQNSDVNQQLFYLYILSVDKVIF